MLYFEIRYYDEEDYNMNSERGLINIKDSPGEAIDRLYNYYGRDNIEKLTLIEIDDILTEGVIQEYFSKEEQSS